MNRNVELDVLKAIAIIAVVFFHLGLLPNGYLGVDIFLVINGYLITKGLIFSFENKKFSYFSFIVKRLIRLWPLVILAGAVSLIIGYYTMLPDDLENLGQSVVASNFFANNILACITTGNYWDVVNAHKPLMHFWYLGIVVQWYAIYPLLFMLAYQFAGQYYQSIAERCLWLLVILSVMLYLLPVFSAAQKFYYLPFRFFEMGIGGLVAFRMGNVVADNGRNILGLSKIVAVTAVIAAIVFNDSMIGLVNVLIVSVLGGGIVALSVSNSIAYNGKSLSMVARIGAASFSVYVWHQVIFAFYKYVIQSYLAWHDYLILGFLIMLTSYVSYRFVEKPIEKYAKQHLSVVFCISALLCLTTTMGGLWLYQRAGIVRNIPELDVSVDNIHRGMHAEYCDRVYKLDKDFDNNRLKKVMVIGDSYGRDFVNVLLESDWKDSLDISYMFPVGYLTKEQEVRIGEADVVFVRAGWWKGALLAEVKRCAKAKIWGIGTKEFGETNGNVYRKRNANNYHQTRVKMSRNFRKDYEYEVNYWGADLVDFVAPLEDENGMLPAFTPEGKYISQDCRHLTQAGAQYYAHVLDLKKFIE